MKKLLALLYLVPCLLMSFPIGASAIESEDSSKIPLQAGIEKVWSVDSAREEVFRDAKPVIDLSRYPSTDPHLKQHLFAKAFKREKVGNRNITFFEMGFYSVNEEGTKEGFYYTGQGELYAVDFDITDTFPIKSYKHAYPNGRLMNVSITVAPGEDYVFKPNGALVAHWVGDVCYDSNGRITMSRSASQIKSPNLNMDNLEQWKPINVSQ